MKKYLARLVIVGCAASLSHAAQPPPFSSPAIRECLVAHRRANGEFVVFLEDDYKSKVVTYRIQPGVLK